METRKETRKQTSIWTTWRKVVIVPHGHLEHQKSCASLTFGILDLKFLCLITQAFPTVQPQHSRRTVTSTKVGSAWRKDTLYSRSGYALRISPLAQEGLWVMWDSPPCYKGTYPLKPVRRHPLAGFSRRCGIVSTSPRRDAGHPVDPATIRRGFCPTSKSPIFFKPLHRYLYRYHQ